MNALHAVQMFFMTTLLFEYIVVNSIHGSENHFTHSVLPQEFANTFPNVNIDDEKLKIRNQRCKTKCDDRNNNYLPFCYCDVFCRKYNDCCYETLQNGIAGPVNDTRKDHNRTLACGTNLLYDKNVGILLVSECPSHYNLPEVSEKCKDSKIVHPVTATDGTSFRNVYCAFCHNVTRYTAWSFQYRMSQNCFPKYMDALNTTIPIKMKYIMENKCHFQFVPPRNANIRSCFTHAIKNNSDNAMCSKFQEPVLIDSKLYRNVYCFPGPIGIRSRISCLREISLDGVGGRNYENLLLTSIFNMRPVLEILGQKKCNRHGFYVDRITDTCKPEDCISTQRDDCQVELIKNVRWVKKLLFVTNDIIDIEFCLRLTRFIFLSISREKYKTMVESLTGNIQCGTNGLQSNEKCCIGTLSVVLKNLATMTKTDTLVYQSYVKNMIWQYREINSKSITIAYDKSNNATNVCNITSRRTILNILRPDLNRFFIDNITFPSEAIPRLVHGVTAINARNGSEPEFRLAWEQVVFNNAPLFNNTPDSNNTASENKSGNIWPLGTILTYVTLSMSCCLLTITLCVYKYLDLLKSPSGITSKHMMANILAAQLLFIGGVGASDIKFVCTIIGVISHYLWLTSFTWISIFQVDILKMARKMKKYPGSISQKRKFSKLMYIFGYFVPLVIVIPCVMLSHFTEINIGYSNGQTCFITGFMANILAFTLPVLLSLLINIAVLISTSLHLSRYNSTVNSLAPIQHARSSIPIYIKLCIFCACPWILGIIADVFDLDVLRYIFILFAGSHGTAISIIFLLAEPVRKRVRNTKKTNEICLSPLNATTTQSQPKTSTSTNL